MNDTSKTTSPKLILPDVPPWKIDWRELWAYRYMFYYLVRRDVVVLYKQTVLGPLWIVLQPLLMSFLFAIIFGRIAGLRTDGIPGFLFYFANNVFWGFLSNIYNQTSTVFMTSKNLMGKVYFPRLIIPLANWGGGIFKLGIQLVFLVGVIVYYVINGFEFKFTVGLLLIPLVIIQLSLISLGAGFLFSAMTLKYRDFSVVSNIFIQGWMYISPVAYPVSEIPERFQLLIAFNPVTSALELTRYALFQSPFPSVQILSVGIGMTLLIFFAGLFTFNRVQRNFIDIV